jgi:hypothetical protein
VGSDISPVEIFSAEQLLSSLECKIQPARVKCCAASAGSAAIRSKALQGSWEQGVIRQRNSGAHIPKSHPLHRLCEKTLMTDCRTRPDFLNAPPRPCVGGAMSTRLPRGGLPLNAPSTDPVSVEACVGRGA